MIESLQALVNREGYIEDRGIVFYVRSVDARRAYGHLQVCIEPVAGEGRRWIAAESFTPRKVSGKISSSKEFV